MFTKTKQEIIKMLGEFADKELKFGCMIEVSNIGVSGDETYHDTIQGRYLQGDWNYNSKKQKHYGDFMFDWELSSYSVKMEEIGETPWNNDYKTIGQYGLHSFVAWAFEHDVWVDTRVNYNMCENGLYIEFIRSRCVIAKIELDTTKPPMERSEEQDKEVIEFMKNINKN